MPKIMYLHLKTVQGMDVMVNINQILYIGRNPGKGPETCNIVFPKDSIMVLESYEELQSKLASIVLKWDRY